jgi:hypothetical protein
MNQIMEGLFNNSGFTPPPPASPQPTPHRPATWQPISVRLGSSAADRQPIGGKYASSTPVLLQSSSSRQLEENLSMFAGLCSQVRAH